MTAEEYARRFPERPEPIPAEYAGKWVAWDRDHQRIIADGANHDDVADAAEAAGYAEAILQKIPRGPFLGGL